MARPLRVQYAGAIYHVLNRGDRREPIFKDKSDHEMFLQTLAEACKKTGWEVHAWCLMRNHFHLVVETPQPNLAVGMKWFLGTYTGRFNRRHKLFGHVFSGRYKALAVEGSGNGYLRTVCDYVHLNPVRARLLTAKNALRDYPWSSFVEYLKTPRRRPAWLRVDRLLGEMGISADTPGGRARFEEQMEERRGREFDEEWRKIRRGWCLGRASFRVQLLERAEGRFKEYHPRAQHRESEEEKAERLIADGLTGAGWNSGEEKERRKGDPVKVKLAGQLRQETTMSLKWIAQRLNMGTWEHLRRLLYETRHRKRS